MAHSAVSYDWLVAESEAWPFSSRGYELGTERLTQSSQGRLTKETEELAKRLEEWLRPRARGTTLEVLRQIRDAAWFDGGDRDLTLAGYSIGLARRYIEHEGDRICLRSDQGIGIAERAARWRWLSYLLPEDLLIAAAAGGAGREPLAEQVHLLTPHLQQILNEREFAETHLHAGAAVPFPLLWTALLASFASDPVSTAALDRGGPPPFGDGRAFAGKLLAAAVARLMMASYLESRERHPRLSGFEPFCCAEDGGVAAICSRFSWPEARPARGGQGWAARQEVLRTLAHLGWNGELPPLPSSLALYRKLLGPEFWTLQRSAGDAAASLDPLVSWLGPVAGAALPETRFASRAIAYLQGEGAGDRLFARIFWQYQRVRCATFRHLVEEPGTGGLDWFGRHYQRIGALRRGLDQTIYRCALESESMDIRLEALEARQQPPGTWQEVYREAQRLAGQTLGFHLGHPEIPQDRMPEVAIIFHFIKDREDRARGGYLHADPAGSEVFGCRFGRWYYGCLRQAVAIETALHRDPEILLLVRGLDIANSELAVPTWAWLPLFERVRRASERAAARLARRRPEWKASPLRVTCHLGEDFIRLVQGLRRIHEPIEFGLLVTGSRIGHAVALGVDPAEWADANQTLPQTVEERLEDLLWELDRYGRGDLAPAAAGRIEYLRQEVVLRGREIYGKTCRPEHLLEARHRLLTPGFLEKLAYPYIRRPPLFRPRDDEDKEVFELVFRYLTDRGVFERGQQKIEVRADPSEVVFLSAAQHWLRRQLGRLEITVESNPSSNLLIGELRSLDDLPAFRLLPLPSAAGPAAPAVMLSINVDDPITFASHLANEYAHTYFALTRRGASSHEALAWLCQVREHGWHSRFTLGASRLEEHLRRFWSPSSHIAAFDASARRQGMSLPRDTSARARSRRSQPFREVVVRSADK